MYIMIRYWNRGSIRRETLESKKRPNKLITYRDANVPRIKPKTPEIRGEHTTATPTLIPK